MVNLDGTGRFSPVRGVAHVYGVNIWEDTIYWTDWNIKKIQSAQRFTGANKTTLVTTVYQPYDIHIVHPLRQNTSSKFRLFLCIHQSYLNIQLIKVRKVIHYVLHQWLMARAFFFNSEHLCIAFILNNEKVQVFNSTPSKQYFFK